MTFEQFNQSLLLKDPPAALSIYLKALWFDAKDDWDKAHTIIQDLDDTNAAWIHAYLHRKEGDINNAGYWYHRAGKKMPGITLLEERESITKELL
jgi:hypothetical protein